MILTIQDKQWLSERYPGLTLNNKAVSGVLEFVAVYNDVSNRFLIVRDEHDDNGGIKLQAKFKIKIQDRQDKSFSKLPALFVEEIETLQNRHFNQKDFSACLCNPLDEDKFLNPAFDFIQFFEELVIPFLYGQQFYTVYQRWPWSEYSHGGIGLLEGYADFSNQTTPDDFLNLLKKDGNWSYYEKLIQSTRPSKQKCPCASGDRFRDCHPKALKGFIQLKKDMNT